MELVSDCKISTYSGSYYSFESFWVSLLRRCLARCYPSCMLVIVVLTVTPPDPGLLLYEGGSL